MTATPWVDSARCQSNGKCAARLAYSLKATGVRAPSRLPAPPVGPSTRTRPDARPPRPRAGAASRPRHVVSLLGYENRTPLLTIATGRPALLVTLTLPEHLEAGHVDFARQLAAKAWAYAVAVERRYRGLPALPDQPVPPRWRPGPIPGPATRPGWRRPSWPDARR